MILNGQSKGVSKFSVDGQGNINTVATYEIGGSSVVSIGNSPDANLFLGVQAGSNNTEGCCNVFSGVQVGYSNTTGHGNTFSGAEAGTYNTIGSDNVFDGLEAGGLNTSGSDNIFIGLGAGLSNTTGSSNVYIANQGPDSGTESNAIRLGTQGTDDREQNVTYIAGIYGSTVDKNGIPVYVDDNGQLGTVVSSRRFKEQIADMGDSTNALLKLRPVTFLYKLEYSKGERTLQYGLIAEEVAAVFPEMVVYDKDGQPYTVKYQLLAPMLLNELQKQHTVVAAQQDVIKTQQQQVNVQQQQIESLQKQNTEFQQRLSRLESLAEKK